MAARIKKRFITEADEYVCPLSPEVQIIAEQELRETVVGREQALKSLREWAIQNPRIAAIRMDSSFLLRFLRTKKFSVPMAQESIERYLLLRQSFGIAFNQLDFKIPAILELIELGYCFASPFRDSIGRRVIIYRPGVFDPYKYTNQDMCRIHGVCYETLMEDEENQVRGFVHYADGGGVSFPHLTLFTPREAVRIVKNGEKTIPMRHKEIHGMNVHPTIKFALDFGMALISEKIKKRVKLYTNFKDVQIETSVLPKEYGGTMPMEEMIKLWKVELLNSRDILLLNDKMSVRLELFSEAAREGAVSALRTDANLSCSASGDPLRGITGNFRKLEVD
ncbi:alpha-tocopherol transfer protein-like [Arctopsyche grandis]|uniref:alpha-tocopherol transfer protein-like n=1 Tax=Arctopsyche grandis TaxID=121162 RepID=UPI00406D8E3C